MKYKEEIMKKETKILIISIVAVLLIAVLAFVLLNKKTESTIITSSDAKSMLKSITKSNDLPSSLETFDVDVSDINKVTSFTGLKSNDNIEWIVASEPMMSSQAFSAVALKVKDGSNVETIKQEILDNVNTRKWICVSADKLYITNNGNVVFFIMADTDWAKIVYDNFKNYVNNDIGKELEKTSEESLPDVRPVA